MSDSLFNFERDIAPERNNFGFTGPESAFASAKADQQIMPQLDLMLKLRNQLQNERAADLAYETSVFEFKQRKKTLRNQREADQRAGDLLDQIQTTLEDDQLNPFEQQEQLSLIQLQNSDTFANSKVAQQSLLAASKFIGSQMQQRNERLSRKLRRGEEERKSSDTTGLDINTIYRLNSEEQIETLEESYRDRDSAGGEKLTAREKANLRNARFSVQKNIADRQLLEKKERADRNAQIFKNKRAIDQLTLDDIEETLKALSVEKKLGEPDYTSFDGLGLADGTVLEGTDPAQLEKTLRSRRAAIRRKIVEENKLRNKFLEAGDSKEKEEDEDPTFN